MSQIGIQIGMVTVTSHIGGCHGGGGGGGEPQASEAPGPRTRTA
jgi:hypothetical protein